MLRKKWYSILAKKNVLKNWKFLLRRKGSVLFSEGNILYFVRPRGIHIREGKKAFHRGGGGNLIFELKNQCIICRKENLLCSVGEWIVLLKKVVSVYWGRKDELQYLQELKKRLGIVVKMVSINNRLEHCLLKGQQHPVVWS